MLQVSTSEDKQNTCFKFIGSNNTPKQTTHLLTDNTSLLTSSYGDCEDTCSFYSGPSDTAIMAFGERCETNGTIAYSGSGESCGTIASAGGESCGSIASSSFSSGGSFSGSCCSYSC